MTPEEKIAAVRDALLGQERIIGQPTIHGTLAATLTEALAALKEAKGPGLTEEEHAALDETICAAEWASTQPRDAHGRRILKSAATVRSWLARPKADDFERILKEATPQSGAPDAPRAQGGDAPATVESRSSDAGPSIGVPVAGAARTAPPVHCPGCKGYKSARDTRDCPGIAPAPHALSAEEREALNTMLSWLPLIEDGEYRPRKGDIDAAIVARALLARTAEAK